MSCEEAFAEMESRMKWLESAVGNFFASAALADSLEDVKLLAGVAHNELRNLDMPEEWVA